jgi:hypothetical protein
MAQARRNRGRNGGRDAGREAGRDAARAGGPPPDDAPGENRLPLLPDLLRRGLALGLSGVFSTNEALRRAFGDALPREWLDFVASQSERTRSEFIERMAGELARSLETLDLADAAERVLEGRSVEITARITLLPRSRRGAGGERVRFSLLGGGKRR